jgi:hypothetical protein
LGSLRERDHLDDVGVDGWIILKWIIEKFDGGHGLDWFCSGQGQVVDFRECGNGFRKINTVVYINTEDIV